MMSHTGQHIIIIHILPDISRSKSNQTIKFAQLIEYYIIFFLKTLNVVKKLVPDVFIKNQN